MAIPRSMLAAQLLKYKEKYEIREIEVPTPGANDLLIKVGAAGFCHTDYQVWEGVYNSPTPLIPSHENVGTIVALGSHAQKSGKWNIGNRVGVVMFQHACGRCSGCLSTNDVRFCKKKDVVGLDHDGGMAEYIVSDAENTVHLPDGLPFEQAAPLMCAGATTWAGLMAMDLKGPAPIGVLGIGGLGTLAVQFAKALGHVVVAIDNRVQGRALATEMQLRADMVVDPSEAEVAGKIKQFAGREGLAGILICTEDVEATEWSLNTIRPHGVVIPLGLPTSGYHFDAFSMIFNELVLKGSLVATRDQVEDMLKIVAEYGIRSHVNIIKLKEVPKVTDMYMSPDLKGRIVMQI